MIIEVAGTEHVATARFDISGCHFEIWPGGFFLRRRIQVDEAGGKHKERKQEQT
jgi:hypothetical protein